ncbi:hypothetical protein Taro_050573 [Colocasia esculenta]|uniref:Thg1 C-terminal domain-containing protein n=1 Tax=Colocasia esculenta TaxID=4460 RepID=A0A843XEB4_COLES|nr:hypothetical protein [Colocasia esculenta]
MAPTYASDNCHSNFFYYHYCYYCQSTMLLDFTICSHWQGTQASEKNELLFQRFGINYSMLPAMFRKGSCVFRDKVEETVKQDGSEKPIKRIRRTVRVDHCDIIGEEFWNEHSDILVED